METINNITNELIEALEQLYHDYLRLTYDNEEEKKKQTKDNEKINELLTLLITEKERQYAKKYNEILQIVPKSLDEKLEQFKSLTVLETERKNMILTLLNTHKNNTTKEILERLKAILADDKLDQLNDVVNVISIYKKNKLKIQKLTNELNTITSNLFEKESEIKEENGKVKELEIGINHKIKELIEATGEDLTQEENIKSNYKEYQELYFGMLNKKKDKEMQQLATEVHPIYVKYSQLNSLVNLNAIANKAGNYEDYIEKLKTITSLLTPLKGQKIEKELKEVIKTQIEVLNKYKKANQDKLVLENLRCEKTKELNNLNQAISDEKVQYIIGKFVNEDEETPKQTTKIGVIKNPLTKSVYRHIIIDSTKNPRAEKIVAKNKQATKEWLSKTNEILNQKNENVKKR